jgi:DUF2975 family protein
MRVVGRFSIASVLSVLLGFVGFGIAIGMVVTALGLAVLPFVAAPRVTVTVPVSFRLDSASPIRGQTGFGFNFLTEKDLAKEEGKSRVDRVSGALRIPSASKRVIAINAVALMALLAFAAFVVGELRAVLRTLIRGNPFVASNATHIQRIGVAVIVGELARAAIVYAENLYATTHVAIAGLTFDAWPRVSVSALGHGLIILVIAEVFRVGTRLDEEQSLTI